MSRLRIALLGSISKPTTLDAKGGVEVWTSLFLNEVTKRGYTFDLYGIPGSIDLPDTINLIKVFDRSADQIIHSETFQDKPLNSIERYLIFDSLYARMLSLVKHNEEKYDFIIDSTGSPFFAITADVFTKPVLSIGHFGATRPYVKFMKVFPVAKNLFYTFPSKRIYKKAKIIDQSQKFLIHEGIDVGRIPFKQTKRTNLLWFGRIDPSMKKGVDIAISISKKLDVPLDIFTYIESKKYFNTAIKPLLHSQVNLNMDGVKSDYFNKAKVFVFPLQWEEPFGLVVPESMASGTPVIAFARGSMPELIADGKTGFLINPSDQDIRGKFIVKKTGMEGLIEAVKRIYSMSETDYKILQKNCRQHVIDNFSVEKMVDQYEIVFEKIMKFKKEKNITDRNKKLLTRQMKFNYRI